MATFILRNACSSETINWQITFANGTSSVTGSLHPGDTLIKLLPPATNYVTFVGFTGDAYAAGPATDVGSSLGELAGFDNGVTPS